MTDFDTAFRTNLDIDCTRSTIPLRSILNSNSGVHTLPFIWMLCYNRSVSHRLQAKTQPLELVLHSQDRNLPLTSTREYLESYEAAIL
jgi:hypothetical protein